jgi:HAD superfamily hydrolase (TIGR01484 family)
MMKYKALIFDVDGTAVPLGAMEASARLQNAIAEAQTKVIISAATGRSYEFSKPIFTSLGITAPSVMLAGTAIINPKSDEVIWNKTMSVEQTDKILDQVAKYESDTMLGVSPVTTAIPLVEYRKHEHTTSVVYALEVPADQAPQLIDAVNQIADTVAHPTPSWDIGKVDIHITHAEATKQHSIEVLIESLGLKPSEVIGIGDSANDLPIFKATGYHIAMGNAQDILKAQADELAPSVEDDGLAQIIEKYFLS